MSTTTNVCAMNYGGALMVNPAKPVVQISAVYDEESGQGMIQIISDSVNGGTALCIMQPEIVECVDRLIKEVNEHFDDSNPA